jgi:hypothetical protein
VKNEKRKVKSEKWKVESEKRKVKSITTPAPPLKGGDFFGDFFWFFLPWWLSFCVSRLEGRSVRSTERSEARKVATLRSRGTP